MVRCDQRDRRQSPGPLMPQFRRGWEDLVAGRPPRAQERLPPDGTEDDDHAELPQYPHLALEVRLASGELDSRRLVLRWGAPHRRGDVAIPKDQSIVLRNGGGLIRKPGPVQSPVQEFPAPVPVNARPVRFPPWAAGARPTIRTLASGTPNPGTGRPQYTQSRKAARFVRATRSRYRTSRGHWQHATISEATRSMRALGTA